MNQDKTTDAIRHIKHEFMAYRNGIIADTLRNAGMPYKVIFGLQLPQLTAIAKAVKGSNFDTEQLARQLWQDKDVRESRLLACFLFSSSSMNREDVLNLCEDLLTREEADILSFKFLQHLSFVDTLAEELKQSSNPNTIYCAEALNRF